MADTKKDYALVAGLCLFLFLFASWLLPITDPTESNYAETAKEMYEAKEYISPIIYGQSWYDKPIMFYWELVAAFSFFGVNEFAARFFPAVFGTLGGLLAFFFGKYLYGPKVGFAAAVILATTVEYWVMAHGIVTDMSLFVFFSGTLVAFYLGYSQKKPAFYYLAYASAGLGMLTKGPVSLALPGLIILLFLAWERNLKELFHMKIISGLILFAAISAIWYYPMYLRHGRDFIDTFFGVHNVLRATVSEHPKDNYWYFYILIFIGGFAPWSFPIIGRGIGALKELWARKKLPQFETKEKFLIVWSLAVPGFFTLCATKYVTYSMPYMLPVAVLFALYFVQHETMFRRMAIGTAIVFFVLLFTFLIPKCEKRSGLEMVATFEELLPQKDAYVGTCMGRYHASTVFYSGRSVYRLVTKDEMEGIKPHKMSWSSTNVMPMLALETLPDDKPFLAIVTHEEEKKFREKTKGQWKLLTEKNKLRYYLREKSK